MPAFDEIIVRAGEQTGLSLVKYRTAHLVGVPTDAPFLHAPGRGNQGEMREHKVQDDDEEEEEEEEEKHKKIDAAWNHPATAG
jgi:hypothetical protein